MAIKGDTVEHELEIDAPPEVVFAFFTDPGKHTRWMGRAAVLDPRPGGIYRVEINDTHTVVGEFLVVEAPHRLSFTWGFDGNRSAPPGSSTVTVTLTPHGLGTRLHLTHSGLAHPLLVDHDRGWHGYLDQLAAAWQEAARGSRGQGATTS